MKLLELIEELNMWEKDYWNIEIVKTNKEELIPVCETYIDETFKKRKLLVID